MKFFILLATLMASSNSLMANSNECVVHSVTVLQHSRSELAYALEKTLLKKGYKIIRDGKLYKAENVLDLEVRPDLLLEGTLISTSRTISPRVTCNRAYSIDKMYCSASFSLYQVNDKKQFVILADIYENKSTDLAYFRSPESVIKNFTKDFIKRAEKQIPECDKSR